MSTPTRPALRYFGAKWRIAPWIISNFAAHQVYVEPFAGGAGVLLQKPPSPLEVYNDLDREVVNFFRVLRERTEDLLFQIRNTPFARQEWENAFEESDNPLERARRFYVRSWQSYGSTASRKNHTGWRAEKTAERGKTLVDDWNDRDHLRTVAERLRDVQIECRPATEVIEMYDAESTLFYCDPPYINGTRLHSEDMYNAEMKTVDDHRVLADLLNSVDGMVAISGYDTTQYRAWFGDNGWKRVEKNARTMSGGNQRTECLWLNPRLQEVQTQDLFHTSQSA